MAPASAQEYVPAAPTTTRLWLLGYAAATSPSVQGDEGWDSAFGGGAMVLRASPSAVAGGAVFIVPHTSKDSVRIAGDLILGARLRDQAFGFAVGPLVQVQPYASPQWGGSISLWGMAGPALSLRVNVLGATAGRGVDMNFEVALALPLPTFALVRH